MSRMQRAHLGESLADTPRGSSAGADVRQTSRRTRLDETRERTRRPAQARPHVAALVRDRIRLTPTAVSIDNVVKAIASFERTIISARSPYDRHHTDRDNNAISTARAAAKRSFSASRSR